VVVAQTVLLFVETWGILVHPTPDPAIQRIVALTVIVVGRLGRVVRAVMKLGLVHPMVGSKSELVGVVVVALLVGIWLWTVRLVQVRVRRLSIVNVQEIVKG
jgi:hypothetical protein